MDFEWRVLGFLGYFFKLTSLTKPKTHKKQLSSNNFDF